MTRTRMQNGVWKTTEYDALGRVKEVRVPVDGNPANDLITKLGYNEIGQKITQTDAIGRVTRFEYDKRGRMTARVLPMGQREEMFYNALGQMVWKK